MGGDLTMYLPGDPIPGYLAIPSEGGPWPGVVVLHQAVGLDDDIRRITDRTATLGYLAIAPDLIAGGGFRCLARLFVDVQRGRGESVKRIEEIVAWTLERSDCTGKVGVIGFCLGGGLAFLAGGGGGGVSVIAPNYGKATKALAGSCPVVASYGGKDRIFAREARRAGRAMASMSIDHDIEVYENVGHGFMNQTEGHRVMNAITRPLLAVGYDRDASEDAWKRIEGFFGKYLR